MPLPIILGVAAGIAALGGVGSGVHGAVKLKDAKDTMDRAKRTQQAAVDRCERANRETTKVMDELGKKELNILNSFSKFADLIEKIQGRPEFKTFSKNGIDIPKFHGSELRKVSVGAGLLLGSLGGAAVGTAGGFAAAGATTAAVMALGTASTGTAIASLSGAALTNATLAALGGGAIAAGGGGIALGTTILGATTLGMGLLVGGIIFSITGSKLSDKADEAWSQAQKTSVEATKICDYLYNLKSYAGRFSDSLNTVYKLYDDYFKGLNAVINLQGKKDWWLFTPQEQKMTENACLLVGLLYNMCKVQLVLKDSYVNGQNAINVKGIMDAKMEADEVLTTVKAA